MARRPDPDALGTAEVPVGTLDAGAVATVGPGGVVHWGAHRLSWWVRAEDRWYRPVQEASERRRRVEGLPVVETAVRVPGGDIVATAFGAVLDGGSAGVVVEVRNDSAVPVALAMVVESPATMRSAPAGVVVDGGGAVHATRDVRDRAAAADAAALATQLELDPIDRARADDGPGATALVVPLAHTATVGVVVDPGAASSDPQVPAAPAVNATAVRAGWERVAGRAPRLELPEPASVRQWAGAICDVVLSAAGPGPEALSEQLASAVALARLGFLDEADPLVDGLLGAVRRDGSLTGHDALDDTAGLLRLAAALWSGGVDPVAAEQLVGPVARAARWLERGRRRPPLDGRASVVAAALVAPVGLLEDLDQPDLARHLVSVAARLSERPGVAPAASDGGDDASSGSSPAATVLELLDEMVREVPSGLRLGGGWRPSWAGSQIEVHGVPTRFGRVSWAVRWHGERPALLWEVEPWPDRSVDPPQVTTPALDPAWSGSGWAGEALLAAPPTLVVSDGGSFS